MSEQTPIEQDTLALTVCPECGYSLESLPDEGVCPECGARYDQQFVVLFGETPEGVGRAASRITPISLLACAAFVVLMSIRNDQLYSRSAFVLLTCLFIYAAIWLARRASVNREIIYQVWLSERGFAVRRPRSEMAGLAHVERGLPYLLPAALAFTFGASDRRLSTAFVFGVLLFVVVAVSIGAFMNRPARRRRVRSGDERVPTLIGWSASDTATIDVVRPGAARLRITSRSYLGRWKWQEWRAVDAVVRLTYEQATELRSRIVGWIAAQSMR